MRAGEFAAALFGALARGAGARYDDNSQAYYQLGDEAAREEDLRALAAESTVDLARAAALSSGALAREIAHKSLLYGLLGDDDSRALLVSLAAFGVLGHLRVRLPYFGTDNAVRREELLRATEAADEADAKLLDAVSARWRSDRFSLFDLRRAGRDLKVYSIGEEVYRYFHNPSYRCATPRGAIGVRPGDVVIDCGAAFGDISLQFAEAAGPDGRVLCFEPYRLFLDVFFANMAANPGLASRIEVVERGVWDEDDAVLSFIEGGGGSCIDESNSATVKIRTVTLDSAVAAAGLDRVDFIKMDIEGAELRALRGAEGVLRRFRPRLAVCLYHQPEDFCAIPEYLDGLGLGYRFHLNHHYVNEWETVLYAEATEGVR
ncbi:FkbM family methyltransferase [Desulfovibrio sp. X2]|uniref:FkbM family methyltransferase n=1 Tax=Desulfovibrio sp. X2 TaxID=941449 RepID=UPI0004234B0E|nr:FkbM family methyltransferase [Desulfovibrio sp. X2]